MKPGKALRKVAKQQGVPVETVYREIQNAIDEAWSNPEGEQYRKLLFPEGKPDPETFLQRVSEITR